MLLSHGLEGVAHAGWRCGARLQFLADLEVRLGNGLRERGSGRDFRHRQDHALQQHRGDLIALCR